MTSTTDPKLQFIKKSLADWGKNHFRIFPWRSTHDPYRIMIAEFMLHRTKAAQIVTVYEQFISRYPDVFTLASSDISDIQNVTEHLGLHWRARHFIEAAMYIAQKYNGKFPDSIEELRSIPGFGEYIGGVVYVLCYGRSYPVVDSNIARFISRVYSIKSSGELRRNKEVTDIARKLFTVKNPGQLLFSILDFTAEICKAKNPNHEICPINTICLFYRSLDKSNV